MRPKPGASTAGFGDRTPRIEPRFIPFAIARSASAETGDDRAVVVEMSHDYSVA
jgi:hypothetical protein